MALPRSLGCCYLSVASSKEPRALSPSIRGSKNWNPTPIWCVWLFLKILATTAMSRYQQQKPQCIFSPSGKWRYKSSLYCKSLPYASNAGSFPLHSIPLGNCSRGTSWNREDCHCNHLLLVPTWLLSEDTYAEIGTMPQFSWTMLFFYPASLQHWPLAAQAFVLSVLTQTFWHHGQVKHASWSLAAFRAFLFKYPTSLK